MGEERSRYIHLACLWLTGILNKYVPTVCSNVFPTHCEGILCCPTPSSAWRCVFGPVITTDHSWSRTPALMDVCTDGRPDGRTDGRTDERPDWRTDGRTDGTLAKTREERLPSDSLQNLLLSGDASFEHAVHRVRVHAVGDVLARDEWHRRGRQRLPGVRQPRVVADLLERRAHRRLSHEHAADEPDARTRGVTHGWRGDFHGLDARTRGVTHGWRGDCHTGLTHGHEGWHTGDTATVTGLTHEHEGWHTGDVATVTGLTHGQSDTGGDTWVTRWLWHTDITGLTDGHERWHTGDAATVTGLTHGHKAWHVGDAVTDVTYIHHWPDTRTHGWRGDCHTQTSLAWHTDTKDDMWVTRRLSHTDITGLTHGHEGWHVGDAATVNHRHHWPDTRTRGVTCGWCGDCHTQTSLAWHTDTKDDMWVMRWLSHTDIIGLTHGHEGWHMGDAVTVTHRYHWPDARTRGVTCGWRGDCHTQTSPAWHKGWQKAWHTNIRTETREYVFVLSVSEHAPRRPDSVSENTQVHHKLATLAVYYIISLVKPAPAKKNLPVDSLPIGLTGL